MKKLLTGAAAAALAVTTAAPAAAATATVSSAAAAPPAVAPAHGTSAHPHGADDAGTLDLQSHRGGRGEWTEESLTAFEQSLRLGVTTLELDTHLSEDDRILVWHDDVVQADKCRDTAAAVPGDPEFPYVGDRVRELTLAQIRTLDCGYVQLEGYPLQDVVEGNRIAELQDVYELVRAYGASDMRFNVETKVEVAGEAGRAEQEALTAAVVGAIQDSGFEDSTTLQSFDWASLDHARTLDEDLALVALTDTYEWAGLGEEGADDNLGGLDLDDHGGSFARAAAAKGYDALSPNRTTVTPAMVEEAHGLGLGIVPWTVNNRVETETLIDWGVDGIITDHPTTLRDVMADRGLPLPEAYDEPGSGHGHGGKHHDHGGH